jgi:triosephosphate isomerase
MRNKIIAGNWKMNGTKNECLELLLSILKQTKNTKSVQKIIFPPFPFLSYASDIVSADQAFSIGAQDCSAEKHGAFTSEVSASMIKSVGCKYVLLGHSERKEHFQETELITLNKLQQAIHSELKAVVCIGERLHERLLGNHLKSLYQSLHTILLGFNRENYRSLTIAYEPIWAINSDKAATTEQIQETVSFIRQTLSELLSKEAANEIPILYGGSCNASNVAEILECKDVDGCLIGSASLKADEFSSIIKQYETINLQTNGNNS